MSQFSLCNCEETAYIRDFMIVFSSLRLRVNWLSSITNGIRNISINSLLNNLIIEITDTGR